MAVGSLDLLARLSTAERCQTPGWMGSLTIKQKSMGVENGTENCSEYSGHIFEYGSQG